MALTVLGSGTLIAQKDRSCAEYVLHQENGCAMLDCGPGCLLRLKQAGVEVTDISLVLISHFHCDHVAELPAFLNSLWLQRKMRWADSASSDPPVSLPGWTGLWLTTGTGFRILTYLYDKSLCLQSFLNNSDFNITIHNFDIFLCS